jgi:hypothetical protein
VFSVLDCRVLTHVIKSYVSIVVVKITRKKADNTSNDGGMIQRVIYEVGDGTSYHALTKTNYSDWVLLMKMKLKVWAL